MGWSSSIHIKTSDVEMVISRLRELQAHRCFVGVSGEGWVGVYSEDGEQAAGEITPRIASRLSGVFAEYVFGVCSHEEGFTYWLFQNGELLDSHPLPWMKRMFSGTRQILSLALGPEARQRMESALASPEPQQPHEQLGVSEAEFIARVRQQLARVPEMSPEEREKMAQEYYQLRPGHAARLRILCESIGIKEYDWNYSELTEVPETGEEREARRAMSLRHLE